MSITNAQYDLIMQIYKQRQISASNDQLERTQEIYATIDGFKALDDEVASYALSQIQARLSGGASASDEVSAHIDDLSARKSKLLSKYGFPSDYLDIHYNCPLCKDTGFIGFEKCQCFQKEIQKILYSNSNLNQILDNNNFSRLSYDYYEGEDLKRFKTTVDYCHKFIENFDSDYDNLLFYGTVGTGKSFLSGCIAAELMDRNHTVVYYSAGELFKLLSDIMFDRGDRSLLEPLHKDIYTSDLLIIDDLGTELTNSAVAAELFSLLNERYLRRRSTIISTNLGFKELQERYADRIFSRLLEQYTFFLISGQDIRRQIKLNKK